MFDTHTLWIFFVASVLLNLTPGNDMIFVASQSLSKGAKAGVFCAAGIFIGCLVHAAAAVLGLSIIIAQSTFLFGVIKYAGAFYLIYLGIKTIRAKRNLQVNESNEKSYEKWRLMKQGIYTNVLNPKVAVFFLSFLPQFVDINSSAYKMQLLTLGLWFAIQGTLILFVVAIVSGKGRNFLKRSPAWWKIQEKITGAVLIALGINLAFFTKK